MKEKTILNMTKKDFEMIPDRAWGEDVGLFDTLVILPSKEKHDSGFRCMRFVAVKDNKPLCMLGGCSDVIHIGGIGGLGFDWLAKNGDVPNKVSPLPWCIDCLPRSGLLRLFCKEHLRCGCDLSSFEIYSG
jgi:hypothetical protein